MYFKGMILVKDHMKYIQKESNLVYPKLGCFFLNINFLFDIIKYIIEFSECMQHRIEYFDTRFFPRVIGEYFAQQIVRCYDP